MKILLYRPMLKIAIFLPEAFCTFPRGKVNAESIKSIDFRSEIYPNPSNNFIVVKSEEIGDIEIYNLLGEKVLTSKKFTLLKEIDISILPKGLYILKLRQTTRKFLRN